jgi:hypothetical protein
LLGWGGRSCSLVAPTIGGVLVQLEHLGEEEVRGYLYPPSKCDRWGRIIRVKGGRLSGPQIIRGKSPEISAPITGSKPPWVFTGGGEYPGKRGRIIRPPDNPAKIPSIFRPQYWEQTTSRLSSF